MASKRFVRDSVLMFNLTRLHCTKNEKAECIASKWAYQKPKEAKAG